MSAPSADRPVACVASHETRYLCEAPECWNQISQTSRGHGRRRYCSDRCRAAAYDAAHPRLGTQRALEFAPPLAALAPARPAIPPHAPKRRRSLQDAALCLLGLLQDEEPHGLDEMLRVGGVRYSARIEELRAAGHRVLGPRPSRRHGILETEPMVGGREMYRLVVVR